MKFKRIIMIVTDSLGIGEDNESKKFGDIGVNTFYSVSKTELLNIPTWKKLGITSIAKIHNAGKIKEQIGYTAKVHEISNGKDTLTGHWEMMGIETKIPKPVFPNGFPKELIDELEKHLDGRKIIGNCPASGTDIIDKYADEETNNNKIILYTSADSVLQICGNEKNIPVEKLHFYCQKAREICDSNPEWNVGRIIARPYIQKDGKNIRTFNRKDYACQIPKGTVLEKLVEAGISVIGIGKINDIFNGQGITKSYHSNGDEDGMDIAIDLVSKNTVNEFIFINLVQFDSHYGHRRNPEGYAENINKFDIKLAKLINTLKEDDLLLITSDHGNDPTYKGTDHTREYLPATIYSKLFKGKFKRLPDVESLATLGNIVAKNFGVPIAEIGEDIFDNLK
ncbi:MAG: phosphopentomutase [Metamycoplasmataceae bacterium]